MPYFGVPLRNGVPLGLGSVAGFGGPADASTFSPAELFAANEPGVWYDPSDFSTLYQDVSGVTPVTALEQPVGLILDKSRGLATGNQLFTNSSFDSGSTGWSGLAFTASGGRATITNSSGSLAYVFQNVSATAGKVYEISADVVSVSGTVKITVNGGAGVVSAALSTGVTTVRLQNSFANGNAGLEIGIGATVVLDSLTIREVLGTPALQITSASRPVVSARYNLFINTAALATQNVTTAATSYTFRFEGSGSVVLSGTATGTYAAGSHTVVCTAGTLTATVTGQVLNADIRAASDGVGLPVYQFVGAAVAGTSTTAGTPAYDTAGFPIYLSFDGSNDSLYTVSINFTGTDKVSTFTGVRKISDAAVAVLFELSATSNTNNGSFKALAPDSNGTATFSASSRGTAANAANQSATATGYTAPITAVMTTSFDIAGDLVDLRLNTVSAATAIGDQGAGNFGSYPFFIGRRNDTSLPFNGRIYSLIVRGAASNPTQIASTEAWVNSKTMAYA